MKKVINLKTQYSLKKTYTYNFFKLLNKLNLVFLQNNFNLLSYLMILNFFFFKQTCFIKLYFYKTLIYFSKHNSKNFTFINKFQKKKYTNLIGLNYLVCLGGSSSSNNTILLSYSKYSFFEINCLNLHYITIFNFFSNHYYYYNYLFYNHILLLSLKNS